jgi:hypothetical protein
MDIVGIVTAPARLSLRAIELGARTLRGLLPGDGDTEPAHGGPTVERPETPRAEPEPPPEPRQLYEEPSGVDEEPGGLDEEPLHVDEGATVVAEYAEPGAEEGAGAEVKLAEPWEGYDSMKVKEILARLAEASTETLAAVDLYERSTRERASVIEEADRQLSRRTAPGPA